MVSDAWGTTTPIGVHRYARELAVALAARPDVDVLLSGPPERAGATDFGWAPANVDRRLLGGSRRTTLLSWATVGRPRLDRAASRAEIVHVTLTAFAVPTRKPAVYTVHDLFPRQHPEWYPWPARLGNRRSLRALEHARAIIAVSRWTARQLEELPWVNPELVTTIPEGINDRFRAVPATEDVTRVCRALHVDPGRFLVFVGTPSTRKKIGTLIDALARVKHPLPLVMVGTAGDATETVRALARDRDVSELLRWAGFVSDDDLPALLHAARALVHPSPYEGFGLTPLEAMAAGTPAIVADAGALPETVGAAAVRCDADDPDAWAAAIDSFADDARRHEWADRALEWTRRYDWIDVAARTADVYRSALG